MGRAGFAHARCPAAADDAGDPPGKAVGQAALKSDQFFSFQHAEQKQGGEQDLSNDSIHGFFSFSFKNFSVFSGTFVPFNYHYTRFFTVVNTNVRSFSLFEFHIRDFARNNQNFCSLFLRQARFQRHIFPSGKMTNLNKQIKHSMYNLYKSAKSLDSARILSYNKNIFSTIEGMRMKLLEDYIVNRGKVIDGDVLKVDMFLNHLIDVDLLNEMGKEFHRLFGSKKITKILTVEASGIGIACVVAQYFSVPVLFAKKGVHRNVGTDLYTADVFSFTKGVTTTIGVSKNYLKPEDHVLIIDDFLADGNASLGLISLIEQAGATLEGVGIAVEKGFQSGRGKLLAKGCDLKSLAVIKSMDGGRIVFADGEDS